jgi:hypothetical protein
MHKLPEYVIERVGSVWELYQTVDCVTFQFETRYEAEEALKILDK